MPYIYLWVNQAVEKTEDKSKKATVISASVSLELSIHVFQLSNVFQLSLASKYTAVCVQIHVYKLGIKKRGSIQGEEIYIISLLSQAAD